MKHLYRALTAIRPASLAAAAFVLSTLSATAQTTTSTTTVVKKPRTTATADMIDEAIQRSKARAAKFQQTGTPERFGSEEPFTYDPTQRTFTPNMQ